MVGLTASTLVLLQTESPRYKKIAFRWGCRVSPVSAERALCQAQGSQCIAPHPTPPPHSPHASLRAPPSAWQPSPGRVLLSCAWNPWSLPPVKTRKVTITTAYFSTWSKFSASPVDKPHLHLMVRGRTKCKYRHCAWGQAAQCFLLLPADNSPRTVELSWTELWTIWCYK